MATRAEKAAAKAQGIADAWNAKHPEGTLVKYWRGRKEGDPSGTGATLANEAQGRASRVA